MTQLFNRKVAVEVGALRVEDLRVAFKVEKTAKVDLNTAEVQIYNLAEQTRRAIQTKHAPVRLIVGYGGELEMIFSGDVEKVTHTKNGTDWVSKVVADDGAVAARTKRLAKGYGAATKAEVVLVDAIKAAGLALGNAMEAMKTATKTGTTVALNEYAKGFAVAGQAVDVAAKIARSQGYDFSIQNGTAQLVRRNGVVDNVHVMVLSEGTGLIGTPEVGEKGVIKARALIRQRLIPGHKVRLESKVATGFFRVNKTTFTGDTHGTDWYAELELQVLK
jgi:hypothetical protein